MESESKGVRNGGSVSTAPWCWGYESEVRCLWGEGVSDAADVDGHRTEPSNVPASLSYPCVQGSIKVTAREPYFGWTNFAFSDPLEV